jgi:two-component system, LytTR family, response regulator
MDVLIVDDERLARSALRTLLAAHPTVAVVGEADSVDAAVTAIARYRPDVVFLDIQMPGTNGFALFDRVAATFRTVFVTAFDEFALRAFEINAIDYLLKPVSATRLALTIERLLVPDTTPPMGPLALTPADRVTRPLEADDFLFLSADRWAGFVRVADIVCISANGPYADVVIAGGRCTLVLKSMKEWEDRLPERLFVRIHRSTIINIRFVEHVEKGVNYSYQVHVRHMATPLAVSRRHAARLRELFT